MQNPNKPYVFIRHYQFEGDTVFGFEYAGLYEMQDGDLLTPEQCRSYGAVFLDTRELCKALATGLPEPKNV